MNTTGTSKTKNDTKMKASCGDGAGDGDGAVKPLPEVIKGKSDWREYRALELASNGMTCVLVHDKESKLTAMSVCVGVGASSDPKEYPGIAHFTEHMCFLGSEKYPGENEYKQYLSKHGGRSNASTSMSCTTYKFDVLADKAEPAVDIFCNFFVAPLFTLSGTSREVNAVDSENSKNLTADARRRLQILKALGDPTHHYCKFSTGNAKTLPAAAVETNGEEKEDDDDNGDENENESGNNNNSGAVQVRNVMLAFHRYHYQPKKMTVVIVGPQSLDTLQEWIVPRFSAIPSRPFGDQEKENDHNNNNNVEMEESSNKAAATSMLDMDKLIAEAAKHVPDESFRGRRANRNSGKDDAAVEFEFSPAFRSELQDNKWPVLLTTLPLGDVRRLHLYTPVPPVLHKPDQSPIHFLSHVLGHEGFGSSFAVLQDAGLITSLSAGGRINAIDQVRTYVLYNE
jgi:secreted Zn-dependent insulinase-like peptidase